MCFASEDSVVLSNVKLVRPIENDTDWDSKPLTFITGILKLSKNDFSRLPFIPFPPLSSLVPILSRVLFSSKKEFSKKSRTLISVSSTPPSLLVKLYPTTGGLTQPRFIIDSSQKRPVIYNIQVRSKFREIRERALTNRTMTHRYIESYLSFLSYFIFLRRRNFQTSVKNI